MSSADRPKEGGSPAPTSHVDRDMFAQGDDLDRRIARALDERFAPPRAGRMVVSASGPADASTVAVPMVPPWRRRLAIAALIALATMTVAWYGSEYLRRIVAPVPDMSVPSSYPLEVVYRQRIDGGFRPDWVCADDEQFQETFRYRYGQRLHLAELPAGTRCAGLSYATGLSKMSTMMLVHTGDEKVVVVIDRLTSDEPQPPLTNDLLRLHRCELGKLVAYEISPLDQPVVLPHLSCPARDCKKEEVE